MAAGVCIATSEEQTWRALGSSPVAPLDPLVAPWSPSPGPGHAGACLPPQLQICYDTTTNSAATSPRLTASHSNSEVKRGRVQVVLRWGTTREGWMLYFSPFFMTLPVSLFFARCGAAARRIHQRGSRPRTMFFLPTQHHQKSQHKVALLKPRFHAPHPLPSSPSPLPPLPPLPSMYRSPP